MRQPKLMIFGAGGMLGHKLWQTADPRVETWATVRDDGRTFPEAFDRSRLLSGVRSDDFDSVVRAMAAVRPDVVVSCIGVVKQRPDAQNPLVSLSINSVFPHRLAELCAAAGARFVHISTDCVFSGLRGDYGESDVPDASDLYGRTKQLGEVSGPGRLTLRTSIIGRELSTSHGLVEWFLAQRGGVAGYTRALFSGLTTSEFSRVILRVIEEYPDLSGVYHVAAARISKFDLLTRLNEVLGRGLTIQADASVQIDRSLDGRRFASAVAYSAPDWNAMLTELAHEVPAYEKWRQHAR